MQSLLLYYGKKFNIGGFIIELMNVGNIKNYNIPYIFDTFITKNELKTDMKLLIKHDNSIGEKVDIYTKVFREGENYIFDDHTDDYQLTYRVSKDWQTFELINNDTNKYIYDWVKMLGYIFAYSILNKDAVMLHGVIMEYNGMGIVLSAKSGTGKTTHARLWRDNENALIINGDRVICKKENNVWYAYSSPWSGSSGECINRKVPIKTIVMLEQSPINEVDEISNYDASLKLIERVLCPRWEPNLINKAIDIIEKIVSEVPILKLKCRPDVEAVEVLKEAVKNLK